MQLRLALFLVLSSLVFVFIVWKLILRGQLRHSYALLWLLTSVVFFALVVFRDVPKWIAEFFQVVYAPSFYFAVAILFILLILLQQTIVISTLSRQNKGIAQQYAILQWRLEQIEESRSKQGEQGQA